MAFKICQNAFPVEVLPQTALGAHDARPDPSQLGRGHRSLYHIPLFARLSHFRRSPLGDSICWGHCPQIFLHRAWLHAGNGYIGHTDDLYCRFDLPHVFRSFASLVVVATPNVKSTDYKGRDKGNADLYSASSRTPLTRSGMDHTVLPANNTIFAFNRKHSPAAPPRIDAWWRRLGIANS